ncbi:hypothetical protein THER_0442 [Thermodesulfovibrio sp. N1]|nr:hypothetical protein THER_0442 [Thermodesulfovibrio sp. N1]
MCLRYRKINKVVEVEIDGYCFFGGKNCKKTVREGWNGGQKWREKIGK